MKYTIEKEWRASATKNGPNDESEVLETCLGKTATMKMGPNDAMRIV